MLWPFLSTGQQLDGLGSQQAFSIKGNFSANFIGYGVSGIENRMHPFSTLFSANATASVYGISIPFSFRFNNRKLDYTQPFNQFGLSPSYKWATAHVGYRNVNFSNFTMAGHSFLGGGLELKPGKFGMGFVYGRFKKATTAFEQAIDTTQTLTRKGFGARIGVGSDQTFVDLVFLKIKDDSTSVVNPLSNTYLPAEENAVAGINTRIKLSKSLSFETEIAASIYTTDITAPELESSQQKTILEPIGGIIAINQSTELLTAIRSAFNLRVGSVNTRLEYRRIDPGYRSMGAYFMNNDLENLTIAPSFSLFNRKLNLRGSIGLQRDNLRNTKKATSLRTISSAQASFNPGQVFGLDISYSNYSSNQRAGRLPLIDSLKLYQATSNLNVTPRLLFAGQRYSHMIMLVLSRMELRDYNIFTSQYTENQASLINFSYNLNLNEHKASIMIGANYNMLKNYLATTEASGITIGAAKTFLDGKLNLGLNNSFIQMDYPQSSGMTMNTTLTSAYRLSNKHSLRFNLFLIKSKYPDEMLTPNFNETKGDMCYVYTF